MKIRPSPRLSKIFSTIELRCCVVLPSTSRTAVPRRAREIVEIARARIPTPAHQKTHCTTPTAGTVLREHTTLALEVGSREQMSKCRSESSSGPGYRLSLSILSSSRGGTNSKHLGRSSLSDGSAPSDESLVGTRAFTSDTETRCYGPRSPRNRFRFRPRSDSRLRRRSSRSREFPRRRRCTSYQPVEERIRTRPELNVHWLSCIFSRLLSYGSFRYPVRPPVSSPGCSGMRVSALTKRYPQALSE